MELFSERVEALRASATHPWGESSEIMAGILQHGARAWVGARYPEGAGVKEWGQSCE